MYIKIRQEKNEDLLIELIKAKKLQVGVDRNAEGLDAFMLGVDCEFTI